MDEFPAELMIEILNNLPIKNIFRNCRINKKINSICNDELFWKDKIYRDYPQMIDKPEYLKWKKVAMLIANDYIRKIPVYLNDSKLTQNGLIGYLWVIYTESLRDLLFYVTQLLIKALPNTRNKYDISFYSNTFKYQNKPWRRMLTIYFPLNEYYKNKLNKQINEDIISEGKSVPASNIWELADFVQISLN